MDKVSVVVPVRNEEAYLRKSVLSLLNQTYPSSDYEVIVVDGRSSDRSREIVKDLGLDFSNLLLLDNPSGIVPTAMNIGIRNSSGSIIVRADAHNEYPSDYIANCVLYLRQTKADNVGGPWITTVPSEDLSGRLVAAVLTNPFGVGNAWYRTSQKEGLVDTVPFGAFRRDLFERVGFYNEKLVRNQDTDLNARIRRAGGTIYLTPALATKYHPVKTFPRLLRQTFRNNLRHLFTLKENAHSLELRHLAPAMLLCGLALLSLLAVFSLPAAVVLLGVIGLHLVVGSYFAIRFCQGQARSVVSILPLALLAFHLVYGMGVLAGVVYLFKKPPVQPIRPGLHITAT